MENRTEILIKLLSENGFYFTKEDLEDKLKVCKLNRIANIIASGKRDLDFCHSGHLLLKQKMSLFDPSIKITKKDLSSIDFCVKRSFDKKFYNMGLESVFLAITNSHEIKQVEDNKSKMSSLGDLYPNEPIECLGLSRRVIKTLQENEINTLYDLLSYTKTDLRVIDSNREHISEIVGFIHESGLKFIEELSIEEKKNIIRNTTKDVLFNSTCGWIDIVREYGNPYINTIGELAKSYYINEKYLKAAKELCLESLFIKKDKDLLKYINYEELLNMPIVELDLSSRARSALCYANFQRKCYARLSDLIELKKRDILNLPDCGTRTKEQIIDYVHSLGLYFADEKKKYANLKLYVNSIRMALDNPLDDLINQENELSSKYDELLNIKERLCFERECLTKLKEELMNREKNIALDIESIDSNILDVTNNLNAVRKDKNELELVKKK